jgi:hypothetical protein
LAIGLSAMGRRYSTARANFISSNKWNEKQLTFVDVLRAGRALHRSPFALSYFGMSPLIWYPLGIRIAGRTAVEATRDCQAEPLARAAAEALRSNEVDVTDVIDPFLGSGNLAYHVARGVKAKRILGIDLDATIVEAAKTAFARLRSLGRLRDIDIEFHHGDWSNARGYKRNASSIVILAPPWGAARTERGLDLDRTAPAVDELLTLVGQQVLAIIPLPEHGISDPAWLSSRKDFAVLNQQNRTGRGAHLLLRRS